MESDLIAMSGPAEAIVLRDDYLLRINTANQIIEA
jgi:hypothetical protein